MAVASEMMSPPGEARCEYYASISSLGTSPGCRDRERVNGAITTRCDSAYGPTRTGVKRLADMAHLRFDELRVR